MAGPPFACPCCGYLTLPHRELYDICPVCFWEDDGQDERNADEDVGGPNHMTLTQARNNFDAFGAFDRGFLDQVRPPLPEEHWPWRRP